ncbi:hypothetical protein GCM10018955_31740 [Planomonospora venezuelensis]
MDGATVETSGFAVEVGGLIVAVGGLVVAVCGLVTTMVAIRYAARQSTAAAEQVRISNGIAGVTTTQGVFNLLHQTLRLFVEHPELYPYFYEAKPIPPKGKDRARIHMTAEMLADVLSSALQMSRQVPSAKDGLTPWVMYATHMVATCLPLQEVMKRHPGWWPHLESLSPLPDGSPSAETGPVTPARPLFGTLSAPVRQAVQPSAD